MYTFINPPEKARYGNSMLGRIFTTFFMSFIAIRILSQTRQLKFVNRT